MAHWRNKDEWDGFTRHPDDPIHGPKDHRLLVLLCLLSIGIVGFLVWALVS